MANANDYRITTPYGQVAGYPLNNGFHRGIDYGAPEGCPVIVNGVQIGKVGHTGAADGAHLHVGKWQGSQVFNPGSEGFSFGVPVRVYDTPRNDPLNGNSVRIAANGYLYCYLHLSEINVSPGQVLNPPAPQQPQVTQGDDEMIANRDQAVWIYKLLRPNGGASQDELDMTIGKRSFASFLSGAMPEVQQRDTALAQQSQALQVAQNEAQNLRNTITAIQQVSEQNQADKDAQLARLGGQLDTATNDLQKALLEVQRLNDTVCKVPVKEVPESFKIIEKVLAFFLPKAR